MVPERMPLTLPLLNGIQIGEWSSVAGPTKQIATDVIQKSSQRLRPLNPIIDFLTVTKPFEAIKTSREQATAYCLLRFGMTDADVKIYVALFEFGEQHGI